MHQKFIIEIVVFLTAVAQKSDHQSSLDFQQEEKEDKEFFLYNQKQT